MQEHIILLERMIKLSAEKLKLLKKLKEFSEKQSEAFRQQRLDDVGR